MVSVDILVSVFGIVRQLICDHLIDCKIVLEYAPHKFVFN